MKILRFLTATFGGYLFASLLTISLTLTLPFSNKAEAVLLATMLSFIFWLLFILYSYSNVRLKKLLIIFSSVCIMLFCLNTYLLS